MKRHPLIPMVVRSDAFLSYAWKDDPEFVKCLHRDLTAAGYRVWWDRANMGDRVVPLSQQVRDAVDGTDQLIAVIGPAAAQSPAVQAEWNYAKRICKPITGILRVGEYSEIPEELRNLYCSDFRKARPYKEALVELLRILKQPVEPLGNLFGVPQLPSYFQPRPEYIQTLQQTLMADVDRPVVITSAQQTAALHGMGGVGKSVLAATFARACSTRRSFGDGIIWIPVGQQPSLVGLAASVARAVGDDETKYTNTERATTYLPLALKDRACLLVLDDVWRAEPAALFKRSLGPRCRLLITTRNGGLVTALGARRQTVDTFSEEAALQLLAQWSEQPVENLPTQARSIAKRCGNLPLAIAQSGATIRAGNRWEEVSAALEEADVSFIRQELPDYPYLESFQALEASVSFLRRQDPDAARHFLELAVFPRGVAVPEVAVTTLWTYGGRLKERNAQRLVTDLHNLALIQRVEGEAPKRRIVLHDIQYDYVRTAKEAPKGLDETLLAAYRIHCPDGWNRGPDDGYFYQHLAYHLKRAGREEELRALLLDFSWLESKLAATGFAALIDDFDLIGDHALARLFQDAIRLAVKAVTRDGTQLPSQIVGRLLTNADGDCQKFLDRDLPTKVQHHWLRPLIPSLTPAGTTLICTLVDKCRSLSALAVSSDGGVVVSASDMTVTVWDPEHGSLARTLKGYFGENIKVALSGDGFVALVTSGDRTIGVWDVTNGQLLHTLTCRRGKTEIVSLDAEARRAVSVAHQTFIRSKSELTMWNLTEGTKLGQLGRQSKPITAIAVCANGRLALSGSDDGVLNLWDLDGCSLRLTLQGHKKGITALGMSADGSTALSASWDETVRVWDLKHGRLLSTLDGDRNANVAVGMTPDGLTAVYASQERQSLSVRVWNLERGTMVHRFEGDVPWSYKTQTAVSADGRRIVSGSTGGVIKVWSTERKESTSGTGDAYVSGVGIAVSRDSTFALIGTRRGAVELWDLHRRQLVHTFTGHDGPVDMVAFSPDGNRAVSSSSKVIKDDSREESTRTIKVWDLMRHELLHGIEDIRAEGPLAISPDGERAIVTAGAGSVTICDLRKGKVLHSFPLCRHSGAITAMAASDIGGRAVTAGTDGQMKVWDLEPGRLIRSMPCNNRFLAAIGLPFPRSPIMAAVSMSFDGRFAIGGSSNGGEVGLWDVEHGRLIQTLQSCSLWSVQPIQLDAKWRVAISGADDGTIMVWDLEKGLLRSTLAGHTGRVNSLAVQPDGRLAVSTSEDESLKIWDLRSGECLATFTGESSMLGCVFASDGRTIVARDSSDRVHFLRLMYPEESVVLPKPGSTDRPKVGARRQANEEALVALRMSTCSGQADVRFQNVNHWVREMVLQWSGRLLIFVFLYVALTLFVDRRMSVEGTGMMPQICDHDRILVNKLIYRFGNIERGDVIVFSNPKNPSIGGVSRVVGLPGDFVQISDGKVLINGKLLSEPYIVPEYFDPKTYPSVLVEANHYFVMSDRGNHSTDSRTWGTVPHGYVYGKVVQVYWPLKHFRIVR